MPRRSLILKFLSDSVRAGRFELRLRPGVDGFTVFCLIWLMASASASADLVTQRAEMIANIRYLASALADDGVMGHIDDAVLESMERVPRERFVPARLRPLAYADRPLPIGHGQTVSQPYIVALMTHLARPGPRKTALEVGTGSGYQAAVLAALVDQVYTMEIIEPLGEAAIERLQELGYPNIHVRIGDGYYGWPEHGPYDIILVTAAAGSIPPPLVRQLKPGGRMIIPVGSPFRVQQLTVVERDLSGRVTVKQLMPVRFVPLTGDH